MKRVNPSPSLPSEWRDAHRMLAPLVRDHASTLNLLSAGQGVADLVDAASIDVDASRASNFRVTLGGNRTLANPVNMVDGQVINFRIKQDGTGSRTLAYGSRYKFPSGSAPTLTTTAGALDFMSCQYSAVDNSWVCVMNKAFA